LGCKLNTVVKISLCFDSVDSEAQRSYSLLFIYDKIRTIVHTKKIQEDKKQNRI